MEIHVDGGRTTDEGWRLAYSAPSNELPALNSEGKTAAARLGIEESAYARQLLAIQLGRKDLEKKAEKVARMIERIGFSRFSGLHVEKLRWDTLRGTFQFELESQGRRESVSISEDLIDEVLEAGLESAVQRVARVLEFGLPADWMLLKS